MKTLKWGLLYTAAFLAAFVGSALLKMNSDPTHGKYNTRWDETVGKVYTDLPYGRMPPTNLIFMYRLTKVRMHTVLWSIFTPVDLLAETKLMTPRC